jgi:hypothetical protein
LAATKPDLGKRKNTLQSGTLIIQSFVNGLRIAKRGGTEVILDSMDAACRWRRKRVPVWRSRESQWCGYGLNFCRVSDGWVR